jgi:superoxide reductase
VELKMENPKVYICEKCGNVVELLREGKGTLVCCGQSMVEVAENTTDAAQEKHVPVAEQTDDGLKVSVGSTIHPMGEKHLIEWIEVITENKICREMLNADSIPVVVFPVKNEKFSVRSYCNLHGLWRG